MSQHYLAYRFSTSWPKTAAPAPDIRTAFQLIERKKSREQQTSPLLGCFLEVVYSHLNPIGQNSIASTWEIQFLFWASMYTTTFVCSVIKKEERNTFGEKLLVSVTKGEPSST